ncbi:IclR family transcriptional regulator C-terminal domain-containing protein [Paraburkholderia sp. B3]|uniref:IclR family transcriptional regulator domain-containing protein n=1 Tax=Paraburkholderia sp. B3 TaxID=3134791 RepID=UPI0039825050
MRLQRRCAAGKGVMSMLAANRQKHDWSEFISDRAAHASLTPVSADEWMHEFAEIRRAGYALARSDIGPNGRHLAAPAPNRRGEPLAAMGVSLAAQQDVRPYVTPPTQATWQLSSRPGQPRVRTP